MTPRKGFVSRLFSFGGKKGKSDAAANNATQPDPQSQETDRDDVSTSSVDMNDDESISPITASNINVRIKLTGITKVKGDPAGVSPYVLFAVRHIDASNSPIDVESEKYLRSTVRERTTTPTWDEEIGQFLVEDYQNHKLLMEVYNSNAAAETNSLGNAVLKLGNQKLGLAEGKAKSVTVSLKNGGIGSITVILQFA